MQDDNGKAPPIIGSNRLTVLKPEMSSSPFKYDPLFQSGGENSVFENINNSQPRTNMKTQPHPLLKAVYLAPRQRSHQGRALESLGPPSFFLFFCIFFLHPGFKSHLEEDLEAPFVVFPWNKTNRIQVFWLALASRSRHVCLPSCEPEVVTSEESPGAPISALKWDRQVLRGCLLTFFPHPTLLQNTGGVKNLMPLSLLLSLQQEWRSAYYIVLENTPFQQDCCHSPTDWRNIWIFLITSHIETHCNRL